VQWGIMLAMLIGYGPGTISIDAWIKRRWLARNGASNTGQTPAVATM
jgi:hypothetical protein